MLASPHRPPVQRLCQHGGGSYQPTAVRPSTIRLPLLDGDTAAIAVQALVDALVNEAELQRQMVRAAAGQPGFTRLDY